MSTIRAEHWRERFSLFVWLLLSAFGAANATTYITVEDHHLANQAELIARAEVVGREVVAADGGVVTEFDLEIEEVVRGRFAGSRLLLRVPGGIDPASGAGRVIWGAPDLDVGERILVFLGRNSDGSFHILHLFQGLFSEARLGGEEVYVRNVVEPWEERHDVTAPSTQDAEPVQRSVRDRGRFLSWLRNRVPGTTEPTIDYLVSRTESVSHTERPFTLLRGGTPAFRWADSGSEGHLAWLRDRKGQPGLAGGGKRQFRKALGAWSRKVSGAPLRLKDAGTTRRRIGFFRIDGRNTVLFRDYKNYLPGDFDCEKGGIIAVGGVSNTVNGEPWKGIDSIFHIVEAEIIINDNVECLFQRWPSLAAQVYVHELGHTLGLGHSCGDSITPRCSSSELLNDATMRARIHPPGRGARLGDDDIAAIRYLYDPEFSAAPCDLPPGRNRFCRRCGPCGEGQGNCRRDSDCHGDLVCAREVGTDFGFEPGTNVCVPPG